MTDKVKIIKSLNSRRVLLYPQDRRIAHMPYHALTHTERDTYNARRRLLGHLGDILRQKAVDRERMRLYEEEMEGRGSKEKKLIKYLLLLWL